MKIATFDIETTGLTANFGIVLCAVVKEFGKKAKVFRIDDYKTPWYEDKHLVNDIITELNNFMILVAHNGVKFDRPYLNTKAAKYGIPILDIKGKIIDPVLMARKHLRMNYNSLQNIAQYLNTAHQKSPVDGEVWVRTAIGQHKEDLDEVVKHCVADVLVLEEVVTKLEPFIGRISETGSAW